MIRLRVFDISQGPKSAVSIQLERGTRLSQAYGAIQNALALTYSLDGVTLHAVRDRHVERAPLRADFTLSELGLTENAILVVRPRRESTPSPLPAEESAPAHHSDPVEMFLASRPAQLPLRDTPTRHEAPPMVAKANQSHAPALPPRAPATAAMTGKPPSAPLPLHVQRSEEPKDDTRVVAAVISELQSAQTALRSSSSRRLSLEHTVSRMSQEQKVVQEQLKELSAASLSQQATMYARLCDQYIQCSASFVHQAEDLSSSASRAPIASQNRNALVRLLHHEVLTHALSVFGNRNTTASVLLHAFFEEDECLTSVYTAFALHASFPCQIEDEAFASFVHREAPFLADAIPLLQFLYQHHLAEFAEHIINSLHHLSPTWATWVHVSDTRLWYSARSGLAQQAPPVWLLDEQCVEHIASVHVGLSTPLSRCDRLGLENAHISTHTTTPELSSRLAILLTALNGSTQAQSTRNEMAEIELKASLLGLTHETTSYLKSLCAAGRPATC